MLSKRPCKILNCFVISNSKAPLVYANLILLLITLPKSLMHLNSLVKTQHFPIPLSVTVSKAKKFLVVLFTNDDQTWEMKGEKRTSENRRKISGLEASKNLHEWKFPDTKTSLLRIAFLTIF